MVKRKRRYKRGYPVAVLVGFEDNHAVLWQIFSHVVKPYARLEFDGDRRDEKALYNFHESVVEAVKPILKEGVRTIVVATPVRTTYSADFLEHTRKHHRYLIQSKSPNSANFAELIGSAANRSQVAELVKTKKFTELITETTSEEADQVISSLEKHLYGDDGESVVLYSLKEIENTVYSLDKSREPESEYLLITDRYLADSKQKNRIHRLLQISKNKKVKTRVVNAETAAGNRINQFGGLILFTVPVKQRG